MNNSIVFSIFLLLLQKRKVSREYLAERFEISKRTVSRYMDIISYSGVPVTSITGPEGGYVIPNDYKIDSFCFDAIELQTIIDALNNKKKLPDKLTLSIIEKLKTLSLQAKINHSEIFLNEDKIIIDAGSWGQINTYRNKIDAMNKAINLSMTISMKYINRNEAFTERRFDPYNLILKQGVWYVYGWCHKRYDFRLFKLSRISEIFITDSHFSKRNGFDVYGKLNEQFDDTLETDIIIEFNSLVLSQIEEWLGFEAIYEEGLTYRAAATVYGGNDLIAKIMSFGSSVKVISPTQLKEEVMIECKRILNEYGNF